MSACGDAGNAEWVVVFRAWDVWEAEIVKGLLEDNGFPAFVRLFSAEYDGHLMLENREAGAVALAPPGCEAAAGRLIAAREEPTG